MKREGCDEAALRSVAARVVADTSDRLAKRTLVELMFDDVERVLAAIINGNRAQSPSGERVDLDDLISDFITKRLLDTKFLARVTTTENPVAFILEAARNFTWDAIRAAARGPRTTSMSADDDSDSGRGALSDPQLDPEELFATRELAQVVEQLMAKLSIEQRLAFSIVYLLDELLTDADLEFVAQRRKIPVLMARREIEEFNDERRSRNMALAQEVATRDHKLTRYQLEYARVLGIITSVDGHPSRETAPETFRVGVGIAALKRGTPAERSGYLLRLEKSIEKQARLFEEATDAVQRSSRARPHYKQIAVLVGEVSPNASEEKLKRAENTTHVRSIRARARLKTLVEEFLLSKPAPENDHEDEP